MPSIPGFVRPLEEAVSQRHYRTSAAKVKRASVCTEQFERQNGDASERDPKTSKAEKSQNTTPNSSMFGRSPAKLGSDTNSNGS